MNALHRLAGVQEASDAGQQPAAPVSLPFNVPQAPPIPRDSVDDVDAQGQHRASLPLNRKPSHKSFRSHHSKRSTASRRGSHEPSDLLADYPPTPQRSPNAGDLTPRHATFNAAGPRHDADDEDDDADSDDFAWGPGHPCFPHPNPHCATDSPEYAATRVIRVKRDWLASGDLCPQFANLYPEILDPLVTDEEFRRLISTLNELLQRAFMPYTSRAWLDSLLGAFTGYLWDDLGLTGAKKGEKQVEGFIEKWNNERHAEGREVQLVQGRKAGYMSLDFVVPDPGIDDPRDADEMEDPGEQGPPEDVQHDGQHGHAK